MSSLMPGYMERIKQAANIFGSGLLQHMAPEIAGGMLNELFHSWNVDMAKITSDVQRDRSIWDELEPDQRRMFASMARKMGNLDFITPELVIHSIKKDFPAVASLFLSWPEASDWLARQVDDLKRESTTKTD